MFVASSNVLVSITRSKLAHSYFSIGLANLSMMKSTVSAQELTPIPPVSQLSSRVQRFLGMNPSPMTLQGTNTYLVGTGKRRLLIDTGDGMHDEYIQNLQNSLQKMKIEISSVIMTHFHNDHVGGYEKVKKIVTADCSFFKYPFHKLKSEELKKYKFIEDGYIFRTEGATLEVLHTPGHTEDHVALVLKEDNVLFSGDCVLGEGSAVFEDLHDYMKSLKKIQSISPAKIYPAHGKVVENPVEVVTEYIKHRNARDAMPSRC